MQHNRICSFFGVILAFSMSPLLPASVEYLRAQSPPETNAAEPTEDKTTTTETEAPSDAPKAVAVEPIAEDNAISRRLNRILEATEWFESPTVRVDEGVVFLRGSTSNQSYKEWAGQLAGNTQDVVAVVNRITVTEPPVWDMAPAWAELHKLLKEATRALPLILIGLILLCITWFSARYASHFSRSIFKRRIESDMLNNVVAYMVAVPVFLIGVYLALRVTGLTRLAMTVLGGTGLFGLIIGIAFRDIAENFLASILISMRRPFEMGDLISVANQKGFVRHVSTRGTLLMSLDGNHVTIPNATIYKDTITNFTANPNVRLETAVGIGFDCSIAGAQEVALNVLRQHEAVLNEPEPLVLIEELGSATVNLRLYFWVNGTKHSAVKVKSAIIRLVKRAFESEGISMPDEAREVVFPNGVDVRIARRTLETQIAAVDSKVGERAPHEDEPEKSAAEGDLSSEANDIKKQADQSRAPGEGENLIESPSDKSSGLSDP